VTESATPTSPGEPDAPLEEALAFIARHPHVFLMTRRADGLPTAYAMTARVDGGSVLFSTYGTSAKVANLLREGVARVLALEERGGDTVVEVGGPVRIAEPARWFAVPTGRVTVAPGTGDVPLAVVDQVRRAHETGKRLVLEVRVREVRRSKSIA
jgi:Pyridoxamine 5'-phosphate oxidase